MAQAVFHNMDKSEPWKIVGPSPAFCNAATQSPRKPLATVFFCSDRGCRVSELGG